MSESAFVGWGSNNSYGSASATAYASWNGAGFGDGFSSASSEGNFQVIFRGASSATLRNLRAAVPTNTRTTTSTVRSRKAGANGNLLLSIPGGSTGAFSDTTNSDTLATGDLWDASLSTGTGTGAVLIAGLSAELVTTGQSFSQMASSVGTGTAPSGGQYLAFAGTTLASVEPNRQLRVPASGTLRNFQVNGNPGGTAGVCVLRLNGASTSQAVNVSGSGIFEDSSTATSVAASDLICWQTVGGGRQSGAITFTPSVSNTSWISNGPAAGAVGSTVYSPIVGVCAMGSLESQAQVPMPFAGTLSSLAVVCRSNTSGSVATVITRKNGADGAQAVTIPANTTGVFVDSSHTDTVAAGDLVNYKASGLSTTGVNSIGIVMTASTGGTSTYTLTAAQGSVTETGQAAALRAARTLPAAQRSVSATGIAAVLVRGRPMAASLGTAALTGQTTALRIARAVAATQGTVTLAGQAAGLKAARSLVSAQRSFALSGSATRLAVGRKLSSAQGAVSLFGQATGLAAGHKLTAASGSVAATGQSATLTAASSRALSAAQGAIGLTGAASALRADRKIIATFGSTALTGSSSGLGAGRRLAVASRNVSLTGQSASLSVTVVGRVLAAAQGSIGIAGQAAILRAARKLAVSPDATSLTGQAAALAVARRAVSASGSVSLAGISAMLVKSALAPLGAQTGVVALSGQVAATRVGRRLNAASGSISSTGVASAIRSARFLRSGVGMVSLSGQVDLHRGRTLSASTGAASLSLSSAALRRSRVLQPLPGFFSLTLFSTADAIPDLPRRSRPTFRVNDPPQLQLKKLNALAELAVSLRVDVFTVLELHAIKPEMGLQAHCINEVGGYVPVFADGANWRRVTDRAIISG